MENRLSTLRFLAGRLAAWLCAVAAAYLLAVIAATQAVVARLQGMGVPVPFGERLAMSLQDLAGMANMFLPMVAFALLVAFMCCALLWRWLGPRLPRGRPLLYFAAGAAALVAIHLSLHLAFGITPIAAARSGGGLALQGLAGGAGGLLYPLLARRFSPG